MRRCSSVHHQRVAQQKSLLDTESWVWSSVQLMAMKSLLLKTTVS